MQCHTKHRVHSNTFTPTEVPFFHAFESSAALTPFQEHHQRYFHTMQVLYFKELSQQSYRTSPRIKIFKRHVLALV